MVLPIIVSIGGTELETEEAQLLKRMQPAGVSLFARNVVNKKQVKNLVEQIKNLLGDNILIAVDQEGGRVRRLAEPEWRSYASQFVLGQLPENVSVMHAALIAQDLNELGINLNYAPVLDRLCEKTHQVLKSRCFGNKVAGHGKAMIETYVKNGICACMKHMPGHGQAAVDPHLGLPVIDCLMTEFEEDMSYFALNSFCPAGMTAHIVLPQVDNLPVTMSAKAIDYLIRGKIGFDGLLISDAIDMHALSGSVAEKAKKSLEAGCDLVCYCGGKLDELNELATIDAEISPKTEERLQRVWDIVCKGQKDNFDYEDYANAVDEIQPYNEVYDATEVLNRMNQKKV